jgi:GTP pyrophosphokinase
MNLMVNYGYRIMKAEWVVSTNTTFVAELIITGIDSGPGVIEQLMHNISTGLGLNIRALTIEGEGGYYEAKLKIMVRNTDQLHLAIKSLENLDNVSTVTRVN